MSPATIALVILAGCILLFLTDWIPSAATAVLGCALLVVTGVCTPAQAFSGFSSDITLMVAGMLVVGDALFDTGAANTVSKWIIRSGINSERKFLAVSIVISAALASFLSNIMVIAMFMAIINTMVKTSPNMHMKRLCMPIVMSSTFGGVWTLMGSTPQLAVQALVKGTYNIEYRVFDYLPVGLILTAAFLLYVELIWYPASIKKWPDEDKADHEEPDDFSARQEQLPAGTHPGKQYVMLVILLFVCVLFVTEAVSIGVASVIGALLCIITRCTTEKSVIKNMDWVVLIRLSGCLGLATGISQSGCDKLIASGLVSVLGESFAPQTLMIAAVILSMLVSNFISSSTAVIIVLTPVLSLCSHFGFSPLPFGLAVCYACSLAMCTPIASAQIGISMVAGYSFADYFKANILLSVLIGILIILTVPLFFPYFA